MKRFIKYITILTILASVFSSCDEWLEATSNTQFPAEKLFETKSGFYDALSGVYIAMGDTYAYGGAYTWRTNDLVAYPYLYENHNNYKYWQDHMYENITVRNALSSMWTQSYNIIANINLILRELETHRHVITYEPEYNLIKGELLALRAYVHFDLMRMFGVSEWSSEHAGKLTIPYVTQYNKEPEIQRSYEDTEALLLADLNAAIECLSVDPIIGEVPPDFETSANVDGFWNNRTKHLNYYAAKALAARIYQWKNDFTTAAEYAEQALEALEKEQVTWIDYEGMLSATVDDNRDWTFSTEHLFSLEVTQLQSNISGYLLSTTTTNGIRLGFDLVDNILFVQNDPLTGSIAGAEDIRGPLLLLRYGSFGYSCYKLYGSTSYSVDYRNRMPMIKISEMYYIIAESLIESGEDAQALAVLDNVRTHRGISSQLPTTVDAETELMKEYYREFISEGQIFYWLKHKKLTPLLDTDFDLSEEDLIYPYPDDEVSYGRVQEL